MTLIAGAVHDARSTLVADTKLSFRRNSIESSRVFTNAMNKLALLSDDIAVAISGENALLIEERLFQLGDKSALSIVDHLKSESGGGFIVAQHKGSHLFVVAEGNVEMVSAGQLALEGSRDAFATYRSLYAAGEGTFDPSDNLRASLDSMVYGLHRHSAVGGFALAVRDTDEGFRYLSGQSRIAPDMVKTSHGWALPAGRSDWQDVMVLRGGGATPRAVGIYIVQARQGRLFPQDSPYCPVILNANSMPAFIDTAAEQGQVLLPLESPMPHLPLHS